MMWDGTTTTVGWTTNDPKLHYKVAYSNGTAKHLENIKPKNHQSSLTYCVICTKKECKNFT